MRGFFKRLFVGLKTVFERKRVPHNSKTVQLIFSQSLGIFFQGFAGVMKECELDAVGAEWISIDNFMEKQGIDHVDILHADIQAAETEMLASTINHLDKIDYFIISTHDHGLHDSCLKFFKKNRFVVLAEHTSSESCSGDGLIVARREDVNGPEQILIRKY
jgi:hypothetical protein